MIDTSMFIANLLKWLNTLYNAFLDVVQPLLDLLATELTLIPGIDPSLLPEWATINVGSLILGIGFLALIPIWIIKIVI